MHVMRKKPQVIADAADLAWIEQPSNAAAVRDFVAKLQREKERDAAVIAALEHDGEIPSPAAMEQLRRYAQIRIAFMKEVPLFRSSDIAQFSGSTARNASARASRWKKEGRIFSVQWKGVDYYPAFQFSPISGEPLPAVQTVLEILGEKRRAWQIALWFYSANAFTPDERPPMEVIGRKPDVVIEAAKHEVKPFF
jgi:hypothetical protein